MAGRKGRTRFVGIVPEFVGFVPDGIPTGDTVELAYDELEVIRLLDLEKMSQEEAAAHMGVSRTTVTGIYERARSKVADSLVNGKRLCIEGGNVAFPSCGSADFKFASNPKKKEALMRVAVAYENGEIFQHFGRTQAFKLYDIDDGRVVAMQVVDTQGSGHGALAGFLKGNDVDVLLCGGIGGGAQSALAAQGIELYGGLSGLADDAVSCLLAGILEKSIMPACDHHGHSHGECHHGHQHAHGKCQGHAQAHDECQGHGHEHGTCCHGGHSN